MAKALWKTASVLLSIVLWTGASAAAVLSVPSEYKSIQEAVNAAAPGDEVVVSEGRYKENVIIEKPVALRSGAGAQATVIEALDTKLPAIRVYAAEGASVTGLHATGSQVAGILVADSRAVVVADCLFTKNFSGIVMHGTTGSTIRSNVSRSNDQYGLYMEKSHDNTIEANTAVLNSDKGFFISNSNGNVVTGNNVNLNTWDGVMLYASTGNSVLDNKVLRNTYGIVISESVGNEVDRNMTLPNLFLIMPIFLVYLGIISYLIQKNVLKAVYKE